MKLLGLNSPEIFIILVVFLSILGTKRIEKGFLLFKKLLKFLLSKEENQALEYSKEKSDEPVASEVKEEIIEAEVKSDEPGASDIKEKTTKPKVKSIKAKKRAVKD